MLSKIKNRKEEGFTIIEVLIVLAIAGLIMLIVFLAVPALQRTQRNTARKNDVARVGGVTTEFINNNNGKLPVAADNTTIATAAGTLSQYDFDATPSNLMIAAQSTGPGPIDDVNQMRIVTGAACGSSGAVTAGSSRQMAIQYAVENSGSDPTPVCTNI